MIKADNQNLRRYAVFPITQETKNLEEFARDYLKKGGKIIVNTQEIDPMPVIIGAAEYPADLVNKMKNAGADVDAIDALSLANEAGSSKAVNIVLMGRLSKYFDATEDAWMEALEACVPPKFLELNKKAFMLGRNA